VDKVEMLKEWHSKFGVPIQTKSEFPGPERAKLRVSLINEEAKEFSDASDQADVVEAADALADLLYVVYGAALEWGIPIDAVFTEVHRSNMSKLWADGKPRYREDGKVLKPPTYSPADVAGVLAGNCEKWRSEFFGRTYRVMQHSSSLEVQTLVSFPGEPECWVVTWRS
jgi:predicted HAD superfamily Cof-like phosphohydrolase